MKRTRCKVKRRRIGSPKKIRIVRFGFYHHDHGGLMYLHVRLADAGLAKTLIKLLQTNSVIFSEKHCRVKDMNNPSNKPIYKLRTKEEVQKFKDDVLQFINKRVESD